MKRRERDTWRHFTYRVRCEGCGFRVDARNALGLAAQHFERTGHTVNVDVEGSVTYCSPEESERRRAWRRVELPAWLEGRS